MYLGSSSSSRTSRHDHDSDSRAAALSEGRLIDTTPTAHCLGIPYPVAISRALCGYADGTGSRRASASLRLAR